MLKIVCDKCGIEENLGTRFTEEIKSNYEYWYIGFGSGKFPLKKFNYLCRKGESFNLCIKCQKKYQTMIKAIDNKKSFLSKTFLEEE